LTTESSPSIGLLSPKTLRDGRDTVRKLRRLGLAVLSACLSVYLGIVVLVSRHWSLTTLIAALVVIPVAGALGTAVRSSLAARKVRQLQLTCPACGAPLIDARGELTVCDGSCAACGRVVLAPQEPPAPAGDQLPTGLEFVTRTDEWFIKVGDANDAMKRDLAIAVVLAVALWWLSRVLPEWTAPIILVPLLGVFALPSVMQGVREGRQRRWAEEVGLYCACGVLLVEPGGPDWRRGIKAGMADLNRSRKTGICWNCGRRVWRPEAER
jgi:hypothetical protein